MSLRSRLQGHQTQFFIELLYGLLFIAGFALLMFQFDPRVAAFEGGLVIGYILRVWEKMSIYERIIEAQVSEAAESQVEAELDEQVPEEVQTEVQAQVPAEVETELDDQVEAEVTDRVEEQVVDEVEAELEAQVADEIEAELDERLDDDGTTADGEADTAAPGTDRQSE